MLRHLCCVVAATTLASVALADGYRMECGGLTAVFNQHGKLIDLQKRGVSMLANSTDGPAWTLSYKGGSIDSKAYQEPPLVTYGDGEMTFRWQAADLPSVICSVRPNDDNDGLAFSSFVENNTKFRLDDFRYPQEFRFKITSPEDYLIVVQNTHHETNLTPLKGLKKFEVMYPGFMSMQMSGFRLGQDALLFYTDDTTAQVKEHHYEADGDILDYNVSHYIALRPDKFWEPDYSLVVCLLPNGDYNDMAHRYGKWARAQRWARKKFADKLALRPSMERILTDGLVRMDSLPAGKAFKQDKAHEPWHYIGDPKLNPSAIYEPYNDRLLQILLRHEKLYGVRPGWWLPMWSGSQFDSNFPVYFPLPDYMGDFEKFKNECERNGLTILPHVNVVQWAVFNFTPESQKRYQAEWDGSNYPNWIYANIRQIITNIGRSFERELPTVVGLSSPSDHHGIYLDCFAQGFAKDNNPASPYCEEANCYQLGKLHLARNVRKIIAGPLMTEGRMEYLLPYTDLTTGANGGSPNQLPLWEMVYGDCVVNNTFNSHWSPYFRKMWMMQGGLISSYWPKWGEDKGEDLDIYTETTCQRVIRHVEGTLMRRHDRPQGIAVSQWDNGVVFWNPPAAQADSARYRPWGPAAKKHDASPENLTFATALGEFAIESIARDGIWAWTPDGDFIADHVRKVSRNGETVFSCDSDDLVVIRGMGRWVIRNCSDKPVKVTIYSKCLKETTLPQGKWVRQQREESPHCIDGTVTLEIPANELFVSGIPLYSEK